MTDEEIFEHEFDRLAGWTADAIAAGPADDAIPGACNGSGSPAALAWLVERLGVDGATRLVDTGAGLGGPAAWIRAHAGASPVVAEPMVAAATGARRLFALPAVAAWSHQLPFAGRSFDAALALAVLSTVDDRDAYLAEVRRVLRRGGGLGVLEYVRTGPLDGVSGDDLPANNELQDLRELTSTLDRAGFGVVATAPAADLEGPPPAWKAAEDRIKRRVTDAHAGDPVLDEAGEQEARFGRLMGAGRLELRLVHAVAP